MTTIGHRRVAGQTAAAAVVAVLLAACGGGSSSSSDNPSPSSTGGDTTSTSSTPSAATSSSSSSSAAAASIDIKNFAFDGPGPVQAGQMIMVTNDDQEAHTVTADGAGGFDVNVAPGKTVSFKAPTTPGSYPFHCNFHSNMHGTLTVQ